MFFEMYGKSAVLRQMSNGASQMFKIINKDWQKQMYKPAFKDQKAESFVNNCKAWNSCTLSN